MEAIMAIYIGTNGSNTITGTSGSDIMLGLNGNDTLNGGSGSDMLLGGSGDDTLNGGAGNDVLDGGKGDDTLDGGSGDDLELGGQGSDVFIHKVTENIDLNNCTFDYYDGGQGSDTVRLDVTYQQYLDLLNSGALAAFNAASKSTVFNFANYVSYIDLKVIRIENLIINILNTAPVAQNAAATVDEDHTLSGSLAGNASDAENNPLTFSLVGQASHGTITLNANGSYTYVPAADFNGVDTFTFKVNDGQFDSGIATVTITINPINDAPVANALADVAVDEDNPVDIDLSAVFTDVDSAVLTLSSNAPAWLSIVNGHLVGQPPANLNGEIDITVTASDGALTASDTFKLTINPINDAPVANALADVAVDEDNPVDIDLSAVFTDVDSAVLTLSSNAPAWLSIVNGHLVGQPPANLNGEIDITVTASDGALTASDTFKLTINPINDAPVANALADVAVDEDNPVDIDLSAVFTDVDSAVLTLSSNAPAWLSIVNGHLVGQPPANLNGEIDITVTASDGALTASDTFKLTINPINDAPSVSVSAAAGHVNENADGAIIQINTTTSGSGETTGGSQTGTNQQANTDPTSTIGGSAGGSTGSPAPTGTNIIVTGTDPDAGDTVHFTVSDNRFEVDASGNLKLKAGVSLNYEDLVLVNHQLQLTITPVDQHNLAGTPVTVTIDVLNVNEAAVIVGTDTGSVTEDAALAATGQLTISDEDGPSQEAFNTTVVTQGLYGALAIAANGSWTYTLDNANVDVQALNTGQHLSDSVVVASADGTQHTIDITINGADEAAVTYPFDYNVAFTDPAINFPVQQSLPVQIIHMPGTGLRDLANVLSVDIVNGQYQFDLSNGVETFGAGVINGVTPNYTEYNLLFNLNSTSVVNALLLNDLNNTYNIATDYTLLYSLGGIDHIFADNREQIIINSGSGDDIVSSNGSSNSKIYTEDGNDLVTFNDSGFATIDGGAGSDTLTSVNSGGHTLLGGDGNDTFNLNNVQATAFGGNDSDSFNLTDSMGTYFGDAGDDGASISSTDIGNHLQLTFYGGDGQDSISVNASETVIFGGNQNDTINLISGDGITANGDSGDDVITLRRDAANGRVYGDSGNDTLLNISGARNTIFGGDGNDVITSNDGEINLIYGESGNDIITLVDEVSSTVDGGIGDDVISLNSSFECIIQFNIQNSGNDVLNITNAADLKLSFYNLIDVDTGGIGQSDFDALVKATDANGHLKIVFLAPDLTTEVGSVDMPDVAYVSPSFVDYNALFNVTYS
jgi:VCBS repeat-containing protein